ncbi:MAG TPA: hypothetical protein VM186_10180, partial [Planctomycetota bacterium]|nr:hypothetical protein [Planctomycetota bacterium]
PRTVIEPHMPRECIKLDIVQDVWGKDDRRGHIRGITFRDIAISGADIPPVLIAGFDAEHPVQDVLFENVSINGRPIVSPDDHIFHMNEHVEGVATRARQ